MNSPRRNGSADGDLAHRAAADSQPLYRRGRADGDNPRLGLGDGERYNDNCAALAEVDSDVAGPNRRYGLLRAAGGAAWRQTGLRRRASSASSPSGFGYQALVNMASQSADGLELVRGRFPTSTAAWRRWRRACTSRAQTSASTAAAAPSAWTSTTRASASARMASRPSPCARAAPTYTAHHDADADPGGFAYRAGENDLYQMIDRGRRMPSITLTPSACTEARADG